MNERRAAFLAGEGTLTVREVHEWAYELAPQRGLPSLPIGMSQHEPLMVSIVRASGRSGLTGAEVLRSSLGAIG